MKKKLFLFLPFICLGMAFADANITLPNNQTVNIKYDEKTPDIWITVNNGKKSDSYMIEAIGPDCRIDSVLTDVINTKNILFVEICLGNPGGRQSLDERHLYIFEITAEEKIKLLLDKKIVFIHFSTSSGSYTSLLRHFYSYNYNTKEVTIYYADHDFIDYEILKLTDYLK